MLQPVALLALMSAVFYCVAIIAMKFLVGSLALLPALVVAIALLTAGAFEVFALQHERLGLIYIGILGAEVVLLAVVSFLFFDEVYSTRELAGMGLVLVGTAIAWS